MTGYGSSPEKIAAEEVRHILSKPFELQELAKAVASLIPESQE
jgi:hypothetical protein